MCARAQPGKLVQESDAKREVLLQLEACCQEGGLTPGAAFKLAAAKKAGGGGGGLAGAKPAAAAAAAAAAGAGAGSSRPG